MQSTHTWPLEKLKPGSVYRITDKHAKTFGITLYDPETLFLSRMRLRTGDVFMVLECRSNEEVMILVEESIYLADGSTLELSCSEIWC